MLLTIWKNPPGTFLMYNDYLQILLCVVFYNLGYPVFILMIIIIILVTHAFLLVTLASYLTGLCCCHP